MASLSPALRLGDLPPPHRTFQGHAPHIIEGSMMLRPNDSWSTCRPQGIATLLHYASRRSAGLRYTTSWPDSTIIAPVTAYHQRSCVETYSRSNLRCRQFSALSSPRKLPLRRKTAVSGPPYICRPGGVSWGRHPSARRRSPRPILECGYPHGSPSAPATETPGG